MKENYDRILYVKEEEYYFHRIEGSKISKVNPTQRAIIINGLTDPCVEKVIRHNNRIFYYLKNGMDCYFRV
jgi:hypothetical protein